MSRTLMINIKMFSRFMGRVLFELVAGHGVGDSDHEKDDSAEDHQEVHCKTLNSDLIEVTVRTG